MTLARIHTCVAALTLLFAGVLWFALYKSDSHGPLSVLIVVLFAFIALDPAASLISAFLCWRQTSPDFPPVAEDPHCASEADAVKVALVVPTMLVNEENIDEVLRTLHHHRLANRRGNLFFGLLTDFCDAKTQVAVKDDELLQRAIAGVDALNAIPDARGARFFLLHRARSWSALQQTWLGHERKRGKLRDFNQYLLTGSAACFVAHAGPVSELPGTRFVITLDDDNRCCDDAAHKLTTLMLQQISALRVDPIKRVVEQGYAILQPYVSGRIDPAGHTRYQRLNSIGSIAAPSIDYIYSLYSREWPYVGKGIYCVDSFELVTQRRFPSDWILSHDNLEGYFLRCGPAPNAEFTEESPATIPHELMRLHRWVRGDMQILPWMLPHVPTECPSSSTKNPLTPLAKLRIGSKIKGIIGTCVFFTLVVASQLLPAASSALLVGLASLLGLPFLVGFLTNVARAAREDPDRLTLEQCVRYAMADLLRLLIHIATLPTVALVTADAIGRSSWRMCVSRKNMLEWRSAAAVANLRRTRVRDHMLALAPNYFASSALLLAITSLQRPLATITLSLVFVWSSAPLVSWWLGRPDVTASAERSAVKTKA